MTFRTTNNDINALCSERTNQATNLRREKRMNMMNKRRFEIIQGQDRTDGEVPIDQIRTILNDIKQGNFNRINELYFYLFYLVPYSLFLVPLN